ncbi:ATP-binding protein [Actinomadura madurae]|nr:hypothetical protein [Actinomadura madurae]MCP9947419.1 hypothetical protein [Actinomadura madurae]MCP9964179.1 hypothetical protein [Actinomadura madurae]MCP9976655.1 hypothetical protein [Actinomadura madurae]
MTALSRAMDFASALALSLPGLVIVSGYTSANAVVKAELFPTHVRALGVALPYALANALFGGTAERFWRAVSNENVPGSGLGLAIASDLAKSGGGPLRLAPNEPHGLVVELMLVDPAGARSR